tara:strand:+ start:10572 stop:11720 length:1149 start_codon:yes stop_codon:yes gene_type:complete
MVNSILFLLFLTLPAGLIFLCQKANFLNKIGAVVLMYIVGILFNALGLIPNEFEPIQNGIVTSMIPLAMPLLLFSADVRAWFKLAKITLLSMFIGIASLLILISAGHALFQNQIVDIWKVSGMLVGVYTGGTPNMAALKTALDVDENIFILTHTFDTILSGIYLLFLISIGQRVFSIFLYPFRSSKRQGSSLKGEAEEDMELYKGLLKKENMLPLAAACILSILILAISFGVSSFFREEQEMLVLILCITSFGIFMSLIPRVNRIKYSFQLGMYLILVFCLTVASMTDFSAIFNISPALFSYVLLVIGGTLLLQIVFSKIAGIDADTAIITSTALIFSPPFVPVVANAIRNREVILSGFTIGILGYAIGNYLGISMALLLKL